LFTTNDPADLVMIDGVPEAPPVVIGVIKMIESAVQRALLTVTLLEPTSAIPHAKGLTPPEVVRLPNQFGAVDIST
jgi:hypothetical protein